MSEHPWIQENLAAYLAGGLDANETSRLEQHVTGCKPCARLLEEARHVDQSLSALFGDAQPESGFEDRAIERLRKIRRRRWPRVLRYARYVAAAAAVLLVAGVGVMVNRLIGMDALAFPDSDQFAQAFGQSWPGNATPPTGTTEEFGTEIGLSHPVQFHRSVFPAAKPAEQSTGLSDQHDKAAETARVEAPVLEDLVIPLPIGHDRMGAKDGFYVSGEFTHFRQEKAVRGILDSDSSIKADLNGVTQLPIVSLNTKANAAASTTFSTGPVPRTQILAGEDETADPFPPQLQDTLGYSPPSKGLATKGTSRLHTNLASDATPSFPNKNASSQSDFSYGAISPGSAGAPTGLTSSGMGAGISGGFGGGGGGIGGANGTAIAGTDMAPKVGEIKIAGNDVTRENAIQRQTGEYPGQTLTYPNFKSAENNLSRLNTLEVDPAKGTHPSDARRKNPEPSFRITAGWKFDPNQKPADAGLAQQQFSDLSKRKENYNRRALNDAEDPGPAVNQKNTLAGNSFTSSGLTSSGLSVWHAPANEKLDYFKPGEIKPGEHWGVPASGEPGLAQNKSDDKPAVQRRTQTAALGSPAIAAGQKEANEAQTKETRAANPPRQPGPRKVIIRTGEIEFEIESFDAATAIINRLVNAVPGGFVATTNSEKLPNGKVRGSVVVRVPPEHLDGLVDGLRKELAKGGELKNQRIGSQDVTKQYTDLESRLRAARTMEERLLQIIKTGKGEVKDLLNVEKELGIWHTKIEEMEGELRYLGQQVALSTLTIVLAEKEIRAPYGMLETERINVGVEVEDVEKAQGQALAIVKDVKGRITKSELKQLEAGQYSAVINFEVPPDSAGPVRDRLKQLGNMARLDVNRVMEAEGGTGKPQDGKITRKDAQFFLSLYNLANVAPREVTNFDVATTDAEAAYKAVLARIEKLGGRIVTSNLNRQNNDQTVGTINFQVKSAEADGILQELKAIGETLRHQTIENADTQNTTKSKRGFVLQILAYGAVPSRETTTMQLATPDVPASFRKLQEAIATAKGRMLSAQLNEQNRQNATAVLDFEVRREGEAGVRAALDSLGDVLSRNVTRVPENENALNSKVRLQVTMIDAARIPPRESTTLALEVTDVDMVATNFSSLVREKGGRTTGSNASRERSGKITSRLIFYVPLAAASEVVERFKSAGVVRVFEKERNPQVSDGSLAVARFDVTLSNSDLIVPSDQGLWPQIRKGLSTSFVGLSWSLTVVIIGILFVLPWIVAIYAGYRIVRWMRRSPRSA